MSLFSVKEVRSHQGVVTTEYKCGCAAQTVPPNAPFIDLCPLHAAADRMVQLIGREVTTMEATGYMDVARFIKEARVILRDIVGGGDGSTRPTA